MEIIRKNIEKLVDKVFLPKYNFMVSSIEIGEVDKKGLPSYNDEVYFIKTVIHFHKDFFNYTDPEGEHTQRHPTNVRYMDAILSEITNLVSYVIPSDQVYVSATCYYGDDKFRGRYSLYKKTTLMTQSGIDKTISEIKYKIEMFNL